MKHFLHQIRHDERGVLTFEWILLLTLLVIGIVGGLSGVRDAIISELGDVAGAIICIDQSYSLAPDPCFGKGGMVCIDQKETINVCRPAKAPISQGGNSQGGGP